MEVCSHCYFIDFLKSIINGKGVRTGCGLHGHSLVSFFSPQVNPIQLFFYSCTVCETEGLLTNDVEILDSIIGSPSILSNSHVNYPINDLVSTSGRGWCAMGDLGSDPYIQLNFTSMVSLTYMKAEGLFRAFVSQFRFEVQDESGNFNIYGITSEPTVRT